MATTCWTTLATLLIDANAAASPPLSIGTQLGSRLLAPDELVVEQSGTFVHAVPLPVRLLLFGTGPEIEPLRQIA
jgi:hypothetical protein